MSEILVGSITEASEDIGLSEFFVGVFVVAIVGNAAEHWVAVLVAAKDKMDLAVNIAIGSSAQIALFVAPVLVLLSFVVGDDPMALVFNGYELGALLFAVLIGNLVTQDGESNWFEGVQLLSLYAVLRAGLLLRLTRRRGGEEPAGLAPSARAIRSSTARFTFVESCRRRGGSRGRAGGRRGRARTSRCRGR